MLKKVLVLGLLTLLVFGLVGTGSAGICGTSTTKTLYAGKTMVPVGAVIVWNDEENLYVKYALNAGYTLDETMLSVNETLSNIPTNPQGHPIQGQFENKMTHGSSVVEYIYEIPLGNAEPDDTLYIAAYAEINPSGDGAWADGQTFVTDKKPMYFTFIVQECALTEIEVGDFRTQTQGGWGTSANGDNPGAYRDANFDEAFPTSLIIGDTGGYSITLTSSEAVSNFLPQGGSAEVLTKDYVNPTNEKNDANSLKNVFAGQVAALALSVGFDAYDDDFGTSSTSLGDLVITPGTYEIKGEFDVVIKQLVIDGDFDGMTVQEALDMANKVLGGTSEEYTPEEMNYLIAAINENFVDGTVIVWEGFLNLP